MQARSFIQLPKTAWMARRNWSSGSCGKTGLPPVTSLGIQGGLDVIREDALEGLDKLLKVLGRKLGIDANTGDQAGLGQGVLEQVGINTHNDVGEHLDKAAVAIPGKTRILRLGDAPERSRR